MVQKLIQQFRNNHYRWTEEAPEIVPQVATTGANLPPPVTQDISFTGSTQHRYNTRSQSKNNSNVVSESE